MARNRGDYSMLRRSFCRAVVGVLVAPGFAIAQPSKGVRRIGVLEPSASDAVSELVATQAEALGRLGWVQGQNLQIERRYANGRFEALQPLAEELVRAKVEIIVTSGTPATLAAIRATSTIPIIFRSAGDAVLLGLVASLARPGGNVTGYSEAGPEVTAKYLSLLKELLPRVQRIGVLWEAANPYYRAARDQFERTSRSVGLEAVFVESDVTSEFGEAIAQLERQHVQALVLPTQEFVWRYRFEIVDAAIKHGWPTMANESEMVRDAGFLIAYSTTQAEQDRAVAEFIDRILRGAKPGDLPVRQPTKFDLAINLKTARALRLTIPKELLLRADEVIQ